MTLQQVRFLGSSVRSFTSSLGWRNQISECTINLVDDRSNGDNFNPQSTGAPVHFVYGDFRFSGLLQSYKIVNEQSGFPVYEVKLIDPRELLEGVQLILDNYNGDTSSIPNLYNVYAYWENQTFGSSLINDGGMPWEKVVNGFINLSNITPIQYKNYEFRIVLSAALLSPILPSYYRINSGFSASLMDIITQICDDAGYDFFFRLENVNGLNYIVLNTASRITQPILGNISTFIANNTSGQAISSEYGEEMRNEVSSKFLVGGNVEVIYLQTPVNGDNTTFIDDTITQFWGTHEDGTPIIGIPFSNNPPSSGEYGFYIPSRGVNVFGVGEVYPTDVMEMRSALGGQAGWETYLWSQNENYYSPHYQKPNRIGIISNLRQDVVNVLKSTYTDEAKFRALDLRTLAPLTGKLLNQQGAFIANTEENVKVLFDYVSNYANEHYGRKFMVRIPFVFATIETDTNLIRTSVETCEGGYVSPTEIRSAIDNGYLPPNIFNLTLDDGRVESYCRFSNAQNLNLSDIPPDSISIDIKELPIINNNKTNSTNLVTYAYIKCTVDPKIYYLDNDTLFSPRVVITLPGRVVPKITDGDDFAGVLRVIFTEHIKNNIGINNQATINSMINEVFNRFGGEQLLYGMSGKAVTPDLVGVALQSNINTYGPWYSLGAIGKIETQRETSLVPWNYGSYEALNLVANSMVSDSVTYQQSAELGSIEVPGIPTLSLGDQLLNGGPYITNLSVNIGENGVTTTYNMQTWTPRFGKLSKSNIDRITRISKSIQNQNRLVQKLATVPAIGNNFFIARENSFLRKTERRTPHTSSAYIAGDIFVDASGYRTNNVVICPAYDLPLTMNNDTYSSKSFTSLDGLFRPFDTSPNANGIPHFETATSSGISGRSVTELNPYKNGSDIKTFARGEFIPGENEVIDDLPFENDIRSIALRGPLIVAGWGYDTAGKPIPNENPDLPNNNFADNHLKRSELWKCGPIDLPWDNRRKVWTTGGGKFRIAKLIETLIGGYHASGQLITPNFNSFTGQLTGFTEDLNLIRIYDGFEYSYPSTPSGARIYIQKEETSNEWFVFAAGVI
jgi:hypothetical protein